MTEINRHGAACTPQHVIDQLDEFTLSYIECALWSTNDEQGGDPLDDNYGPEDIAPETLEAIIADCKHFQRENAADITAGGNRLDYSTSEHAGYDFWLTRNGHGCGFWDGDWLKEIGDHLTKASKTYGEVNLYVGDDGRVW